MVNNHFGEFWTYHFPETLVRLFQMNVKNRSLFEKQKLGKLCIAVFGSKSCFEAFVFNLTVRGGISERVWSKFPMSEKQKQLNKIQHYFSSWKTVQTRSCKVVPKLFPPPPYSTQRCEMCSLSAHTLKMQCLKAKCAISKFNVFSYKSETLLFFNATRSKCARPL